MARSQSGARLANPVTVARIYGKALEKLVRYSEALLVIVSRSNSQSLSEWGRVSNNSSVYCDYLL
jgi:hypothetical protein